jgi:hypothetical protein
MDEAVVAGEDGAIDSDEWNKAGCVERRVFYKSNAVLCWMNFHLSANVLKSCRMQCTATALFYWSEGRHFACKPAIYSARYCFRVENL